MGNKIGICKKCGKEKSIHTKDGWCNWCYRKTRWVRKLARGKRCERIIHLHAKGLCAGCYNSTFHIERVRFLNAKKLHNIDEETFKRLKEKCLICDFNKVVDIHHLDHNRKNNSEKNMVSLCPNHHKMIHSMKYQREIFNLLAQKGLKIPESGYSTKDFFNKIKNFNASSEKELTEIYTHKNP